MTRRAIHIDEVGLNHVEIFELDDKGYYTMLTDKKYRFKEMDVMTSPQFFIFEVDYNGKVKFLKRGEPYEGK